jgi:hypothetical protein
MTFFARFILSCDIRTNFGKNICTSLLSPRSHALRVPYDGDFRMCVMRYKSKYFNPFFVTLFKKSKRAWSFWAVKQIVSQNRLFFRYLICFSWGLFEICEGIEGKNRRWKQREETSNYFLINLFCEAFCFTPHTKSYRICFIKQTYILMNLFYETFCFTSEKCIFYSRFK